MSDIEQCQDLISQLDSEYIDEDRITFINITPEKILQTPTMALWAQSASGQRQINLGLPSLKTWLKNFAASGPGRAETYEGITYKLVKQEPNSRTTTPLSSLD